MSALAEALVAAQEEVPTALKRDAEAIGYRYMTLDALIAATRPILNKHGLAITQWPTFAQRGEDGLVPALATSIMSGGLLVPASRVVGVHGHVNYEGEGEIRKRAMAIDWMTQDELSEAIPPAYTEFIGHQLVQHALKAVA